MKNNFLNKTSTCTFAATIGAMIGILTFLTIYGFALLNVTTDAWLWNYEDLTQHYLGWKYYRASSWNFPIGLMDNLVENTKISVIYTDSIPLFAVFFKLLSPLLPTTFQYFGLWGIFCFTLQGVLGTLLVSRFVDQPICRILGGAFFCFSSIVFQRMYGHTALAGNWLILLAFCLWFYKPYENSLFKKTLVWCLALSLAVSVHMYYLPMLLAISFFSCVEEGWTTRCLKAPIIRFLASITSAIFTLWLLGGFYGNPNVTESGFGAYAANLNTFINPMGIGTGSILPQLPVALPGQYEGMAYLGLGALVLLTFGFLLSIILYRKIIFAHLRNKVPMLVCLAGTAFVLVSFSVIPQITWNESILFTLPLPSKILSFFGIFRASGRIIWPVMYLLMLLGIVLTYRVINNKHLAALLLAFTLFLQIADLTPYARQSAMRFENGKSHISSPITTSVWNQLLQGKQRFVYLTNEDVNGPGLLLSLYFGMPKVFALSDVCYENQVVANDFYIGRRNQQQIQDAREQDWAALQRHQSDPAAVYVFSQPPCTLMKEEALNFYSVDDLIIGINQPLPRNLRAVATSLYWEDGIPYRILSKDLYVTDGIVTDTGVTINAGGSLAGPYYTLPAGTYEVVLNSESANLDNVIVGPSSKGMLPFDELVHTDNQIIYRFTLAEETALVEFTVHNPTNDPITFTTINMEYIKS